MNTRFIRHADGLLSIVLESQNGNEKILLDMFIDSAISKKNSLSIQNYGIGSNSPRSVMVGVNKVKA